MTPWNIIMSYILALSLTGFLIIRKNIRETTVNRVLFETFLLITNALSFYDIIYRFYNTSTIDKVNNLEPTLAVI